MCLKDQASQVFKHVLIPERMGGKPMYCQFSVSGLSLDGLRVQNAINFYWSLSEWIKS